MRGLSLLVTSSLCVLAACGEGAGAQQPARDAAAAPTGTPPGLEPELSPAAPRTVAFAPFAAPEPPSPTTEPPHAHWSLIPPSQPEPPPADPCPLATPLATQAELALSPRSDPDAEGLAREASGAFLAPEALYLRVEAELSAIRAAWPVVTNTPHLPDYPTSLYVKFEPWATQAVVGGSYDAWDCLNAWYGGTVRYVFASSDLAVLRYGHAFDVALLGPHYEALPGVVYAGPDSYLGDSADICLSIEGDEHVFLFDNAGGDCPAGCIEHHYFGFHSTSSGSITLLGEWDPASGAPAPAWLTSRPDCTARLGT